MARLLLRYFSIAQVMSSRILAASLGILIGLVGLTIDFIEIVPPSLVVSATNPVARSLPEALVWFWTYFTHLSNLGLILVYAAVLTGWHWLRWFASVRTQAAIGGYILLVMLYYHFMLAPLYRFEGAMQVSTIALHYVTPIYYLCWWALFAPHGSLRLVHIPGMLIPGFVYVGWVLLRGFVATEYPYDILDAGKNGYGGVAIGIATLLIAVSVFCAALVGVDRLLGRRAAQGA
jgi:hypothetical protein